jgi:hypothetical protein
MWCSHEMVNRDGTYKNNNNFTPPPFISSYKLGITNPTLLNRNLVLEICKDGDVKSSIYNLAFNF